MLRLEGVHSGYGQAEVLHGISLEVRPGEVAALLGANGAGKTTTLMTISGVVRASRGSIALDETELSRLAADEVVRRGVVQVPEGRRVFPHLTVEENLRMGGFVRRREGFRADLERVFALFPVLGERRRQYGGTLSGGEQQMLAIGRALMSRPTYVLLDEPSLGLAPKIVDSIFRIITEVAGQGVGVLLVEQNARRALEIAQRAYVIQTGEIVFSGLPGDVGADAELRRAYLT